MKRNVSSVLVLAILVSACVATDDDLDPELNETESALKLPLQCRQGWLGLAILRAEFWPGVYRHRCLVGVPAAYCMASPEVDACADALIASGVNLPKLSIKTGICGRCPATVNVATPFDYSTCTGDEPLFPGSPCGTYNYCKDEIENGETCYVPYGSVAKGSNPTPTPSPSPSP